MRVLCLSPALLLSIREDPQPLAPICCTAQTRLGADGLMELYERR